MGVSFKERTEAFDFLAALQEWDDKKDQSLEPATGVDVTGENGNAHEVTIPMRDLSLKTGEKILLKIGRPIQPGEVDSFEKEESKHVIGMNELTNDTTATTGLAPPPSSGVRRQRGKKQ